MAEHGHFEVGGDRSRGRSAVHLLATIPLFGGLSSECIAAVAQAGRFRSYAPGQIIFRQGDIGDHLYAVIEGLVKIVFASERGDEMVLTVMGAEEVFGELALLDGSPRSASAVVLQPSSLFVLPRGQLLQLMSSHPGLTDGFLKLVGKLVRKLTEQAGDLAWLDLRGRLAKLLLNLATKDDHSQDLVLDAGLTQSDLAGMIGASRPPVNRALRSFASRGLIEIRGRTIVIRDLEKLRQQSRVQATVPGFRLSAGYPDDH